MGTYGTLRRATADDVVRLRANPALVEAFVHDEPPAPASRRGGVFDFLRRLLPFGVAPPPEPPPAPAPPPWRPASAGEVLYLDKAWHGVHFLLTGLADGGPEPAGFLLEGGEDVGGDEWGEPVARLLDPAQVRAFAAFLAALTADELARRFDPARMTALDIYPGVIWHRAAEDDDARRFVLDAAAELQTFVADAAAAGDAVVVCIA